MDNPGGYMNILPTEILLMIFTLLPARDLIRCSQVCRRWGDIVDGMTSDQRLWRRHCQRDFNDIYNANKYKARLPIDWFPLYRSLSAWPRLGSAVEFIEDFAISTCVNHDNRSFRILGDGTIGVHKRGCILYYSIDTLMRIEREEIIGDYSSYNENAYFITVLDYFKHLYVVRKSLDNPIAETHTTFENVIKYILVNKVIFYITLDDEIYTTSADVLDLTSKFVSRLENKVISLGYTDRLNILTELHDIFSVIDDNLVHICTIGHDPSPLHQLSRHNIYEPFCWQNYFQSGGTVRLHDVLTVCKYGDVFLLGTTWGLLHIYYAPFSSERLDLANAEPLKEYNFYNNGDALPSARCPIMQIDVIETEVGHTVIVLLPKRIKVLKFVHDFRIITSSRTENLEGGDD